MSNIEAQHPQISEFIDILVEVFPFLEGAQNKLLLISPMLIQIGSAIGILFIAFSLKQFIGKLPVKENDHALPWIQKVATSIYALILLLFAHGFFKVTGFDTMWIDIAVVLCAIKAIPHLFELTSLKESSQKRFTIVSWVFLALVLTQNITPVINFLDSSKFSMGATVISPWTVIKALVMFSVLVFGINKITMLFEKHVLKTNRKLSASARTLIVKLSNILGLVVAFFITLDIIGIDLSAFAFFGGALGIGIGFGLQKIVGNLISGMILIIDKSIKPGDVITLGQSYGVITAMHARYCVMRRRDGTEILIPNENLMTNEVVNWSYENKNVRTNVSVGVSYDSDLEQVQEILDDIMLKHPRILKDPAPRALITAFADSSINFELRFWLNDPEEGLGAIRSDIHMEIWKRFKAEGIEIPFPQRVIHQVK